MARPANPYSKLPGRGMRRVFFAIGATRCRLWLGPDHLLSVDSTTASEEYHRFYFRDIEAFTIRRTPGRQVWNWVMGVLLFLTAGPFYLGWRSSGEAGLVVTAMVFAGFWAVMILVNSLRGSTCRTHIRTAAQNEELPSLGRVPTARKVLARLQPLIVASQGEATPEEFAASPWITPEGARGPGGVAPKPIRPAKGWLHGSLFGLLILETILTIVAFLVFQEPVSALSLLMLLGGCVVCVTALVRQGESDLPDSVRLVTKLSLAYFLLKCFAGYVFMIMFAIHHPGKPILTGLEMVNEPGFSAASAISVVFAALLGVIGLLVLLNFLRNRGRQPMVSQPAV